MKAAASLLSVLTLMDLSGCCRSQALPTMDDRIVGKWEQVGGTFPANVEFTNGGTIVWCIERGWEDVGEFTLRNGLLVISKSDTGEQIKYHIDFISKDEFLLGNESGPVLGAFSVMKGRWRRVGSRKESESKDDQQLADLKSKRDQLRTLLAEREADKSILLARLVRYDAVARKIDDTWMVLARELKSLVHQIALLRQRIAMLDKAITGLEFAARSNRRKAELQRLGLSEEELNKISQTIHETEEAMKAPAGGLAEDVELEAIVRRELRRPKTRE